MDRYINAANTLLDGKANEGIEITINKPLHIHGKHKDAFILQYDRSYVWVYETKKDEKI